MLVSPLGKVKELGGADPHTTNNKMELTAAIEALRALARVKTLSTKEIRLYTDSTYVIRGITQWIHGWRKRGWKNQEGQEVSNRELWEALEEAGRDFSVEWCYVPGHSGFPGNERCDQIAVAFAKTGSARLYEGAKRDYPVAIDRVPPPSGLPDPNRKKGPVVYLSYVDGTVHRDADWKSCEARVKGRQGVRFKKVTSPEEEAEVLRSWGVR